MKYLLKKSWRFLNFWEIFLEFFWRFYLSFDFSGGLSFFLNVQKYDWLHVCIMYLVCIKFQQIRVCHSKATAVSLSVDIKVTLHDLTEGFSEPYVLTSFQFYLVLFLKLNQSFYAHLWIFCQSMNVLLLLIAAPEFISLIIMLKLSSVFTDMLQNKLNWGFTTAFRNKNWRFWTIQFFF